MTVRRSWGRRVRLGWELSMAASLIAVGLITVTPRGTGWAWGSPLVEARWYLTGLDSMSTMLQLVGNVLLLTVPFALAAARWPFLGRIRLLGVVSLAAGCTIETLQWALPLGRVVSPLDAILNATGAFAATVVVQHLAAMRRQEALPPAECRGSSFADQGAGATAAGDGQQYSTVRRPMR